MVDRLTILDLVKVTYTVLSKLSHPRKTKLKVFLSFQVYIHEALETFESVLILLDYIPDMEVVNVVVVLLVVHTRIEVFSKKQRQPEK